MADTHDIHQKSLDDLRRAVDVLKEAAAKIVAALPLPDDDPRHQQLAEIREAIKSISKDMIAE